MMSRLCLIMPSYGCKEQVLGESYNEIRRKYHRRCSMAHASASYHTDSIPGHKLGLRGYIEEADAKVRTSGRKGHSSTHQPNKNAQPHDLFILPPHLSTHLSGAPTECCGLSRHYICLVNEKLNPLAPAQNLFHVLHHDIFDLVQFSLCPRKFISRRGSIIRMHQVCNDRTEAALESTGRQFIRR